MRNLSSRIPKSFLTAIVVLLSLFPLFTSCSAAETPPPSVTPAPSETPIPTNLPTRATATLQPTYTSTLTPTRGTPTITVPDKISYYSELQPGSYLMFGPNTSKGVYNVISVDGNIEAEYYNIISGWIAPGGKEIIEIETIEDTNYMFTYDMVTEQILDVHPFPKNFLFESWSPDRQLFAGWFRSNRIIGVYDWETDKFISIAISPLPDGTPRYLNNPVWSPDGRWIAFYSTWWQEINLRGGVFAIDTACLEDEEPACLETAIDPLLPLSNLPIVWGPNSRYIAIIAENNTIKIYDFETNQSKVVFQPPLGEGDIKFITWTADGKNIAYTLDSDFHTSGADLYLISIAGGEPRLLRENVLSVRTWLEVPEPVEE